MEVKFEGKGYKTSSLFRFNHHFKTKTTTAKTFRKERDNMASKREDQSGLEHWNIVLFLIFFTFLIFIMLTCMKISINILDNNEKNCLQKISVDTEIQKNEWQLNQIELIRKALASDPTFQQSTSNVRSYDIPEGPGIRNPIVQRKYDASLMDNEGSDMVTEEIERTPSFYTKSKFATKIGSVFFRLLFYRNYSQWYCLWYRSNSQMSGNTVGDTAVKDTYMRVGIINHFM